MLMKLMSGLQQSWQPRRPGEEGLQPGADERPANSAAAAAEEQLLFDMTRDRTRGRVRHPAGMPRRSYLPGIRMNMASAKCEPLASLSFGTLC